MQNFHNLTVWRRAHDFVIEIYGFTTTFPREERFGLTSQIRRAAASIPANIAEGCARKSDADFGRFLQIAAGSASELEYHLLLSRDLGFMPASDYEALVAKLGEIRKMLSALIRKLQSEHRQHHSRMLIANS